MDNLEKQLENLIESTKDGGGFGDKNALEHHEREIELLKFKIARRDKMKIAVTSALVGAVVASVVTLLSQLLS